MNQAQREDDSCYFIEGEIYDRNTLTAYLTDEKIELLLGLGVLKLHQSGQFCFNFVGVIVHQKAILCILPKYLTDLSHARRALVLVVKVLRKYASKMYPLKDIDFLNSNLADDSSEISIADFLIRDFLENGLLQKERRVVELDMEGDADWDVTIQRIQPVFSGRNIMYPETFNSSLIQENYNLIQEIHKWAVNYSFKKYGYILDYSIDYLGSCASAIEEIGDPDFIRNVLRNELNITYADRDIHVLKSLEYLVDQGAYTGGSDFSIYGSTSFHAVWEEACSAVFSNQKNKFIEKFPSPIWSDLEGNSTKKSTLRPDIILSVERRDTLLVLDAKYYDIRISKGPSFIVENNPGIEDVTKQFLYEKALEGLEYRLTHNCFLFPAMREEWFCKFGQVTLDLFPSKVISLIYLSTLDLFNKYVKGQTLELDQLYEICDALDFDRASEGSNS